MGYLSDLYVKKKGDAKSYAEAWDAVTGRKKDSEDDETDVRMILRTTMMKTMRIVTHVS